ncbi:class I SAM-dependent methyltransferase [Rhizohabitans arisaemae]|uniref:class I SAM-dependent methyltransferase n=1 Tax=Rhizohabitans arisaemae TaxID=2720610 RepID=UPI0024B11FF9|nr:class I SAM-dependent methyltransferase [Rhizohabitans arisaemae]
MTRGTTGYNRLRRSDRWLTAVHGGLLRSADRPLVVDLGYGSAPTTTVELFDRLRAVCPAVEVVGVEIDPERVAAAKPAERPGLTFVHGGFELPVARPPTLIRAFNVLRQYGEEEAWRALYGLRDRLAPGGVLVEGTCDELGRRCSWLTVDADGPQTITFAARLADLDRPSELAERLPKVLIHRNVPGEPIHELLTAFDHAWAVCAPFRSHGVRARWIATAELLAGTRPVAVRPPLGGRRRWRLGEITFAWSAVGG